MKRVLVVDDNLATLQYASMQLAQSYKLLLAKSGHQALEIARKQFPDIILLDADMPEMDGFATLTAFNADVTLSRIPVIFLTANHDVKAHVRALEAGAADFIKKPFEREVLLHRVELHLRMSRYQQHLESTVKEIELTIVDSFADLIGCREDYNGGHVQRTKKYIHALALALQERGLYPDELTDQDIELMVQAAPLHDIGKIGIRDSLILKPGRLTEEERTIVRTHTVIGARALESLYERIPTQQYLRYAILMAEGHHEHYDGSGYPYGLSGNDIPLCNRLLAVVNVYDALINDSVYRKALSHEDACHVLAEGRGSEFDPQILDIFLEIHEEFANIYETVPRKKVL